jgi:hypothetical protein
VLRSCELWTASIRYSSSISTFPLFLSLEHVIAYRSVSLPRNDKRGLLTFACSSVLSALKCTFYKHLPTPAHPKLIFLFDISKIFNALRLFYVQNKVIFYFLVSTETVNVNVNVIVNVTRRKLSICFLFTYFTQYLPIFIFHSLLYFPYHHFFSVLAHDVL